MRTAPDWEQRYADNDLPWDTGRHDGNLERVIGEFGIEPCSALELGCGTGSNAVWLEGRGFRVTGVDLSQLAIERAHLRGNAASVSVAFEVGDALRDEIAGVPFGFVFDRGCFHSFSEIEDRHAFVARVSRDVEPAGLWLSLIGSKDGPEREKGPPRWSATEITQAVESHFEIVSLVANWFDSDQADPPNSWACLMRRRGAEHSCGAMLRVYAG